MAAIFITAVLVLCLLTLMTTCTANLNLDAVTETNSEAFYQCFNNLTSSTNGKSPQLIYNPQTTGYDTIYKSAAQNSRFIVPQNYTKPAFIVVPTTSSHVQAAVKCGKAQGIRVRVRSGGHDHEGQSYISYGDPFVMIDLNQLRAVTVDEHSSSAWVQTGATIGELYYNINVATKNATSGFPSGICSTVGVGGLFGGGGIGTLMRKYGLSADNVVDALMVDANGNLLNRKSMGEDLFWAIRGGGSYSFGIVLQYKINLVYVPPKVTVFRIVKTLQQGATKLIAKWQTVAPKFQKNLFIRIMLINANGHSQFECLFLGGTEDLIREFKTSFPELGVQASDCIEMSWLQSMFFFEGQPINNATKLLDRIPQNYGFLKVKSDFVRQPISQEGWENIWKFLTDAKAEQLSIILDPWGGKLDEISDTALPFPHRKGNLYNIQYYMKWLQTEEVELERHVEWLRSLYSFMTPYVSSDPRAAYLNYKDIDLGRNVQGSTSYSKAMIWGRSYFLNNFERLAQVKLKVDPDDYFWNEQSIPSFSV